MKQQSRLELLTKTIHRWLELPKVSRSIIAAEIVAASERLGMASILANEGISFNRSGDVYNDSRVNAQKIFRWLGQYQENHAMPERLWFVETIILAAMPLSLRLQYLNDVYAGIGITMIADCVAANPQLDITQIAIHLTKENAEAQIAVISLGIEPSEAEVISAHKELRESRATTAVAINRLEMNFPFLKHK